MQAVIYAFRSPGSGDVYIGKHECDPVGWPRRGSGKLPDGYGGSGVAVRNFHRRHGGEVQWRILALFDDGKDAVNAAERRAVRLARALFGRRLVNVLAGGDGYTSDDLRAMWADPEYVARRSLAHKEAYAQPEVRAKVSAVQAQAQNRPEMRAQRSASGKARAQTPAGAEVLARAQSAALCPEVIARRARTCRINNGWRRLAEQHPEWFLPEG